MGYWFIIEQVTVPSPLVPNAANTLELQVVNHGVDKVHRAYRVALALTKVEAKAPAYRDAAVASDARDWLPDAKTPKSYTWHLGDLPDGEYFVDLALVAPKDDEMDAVVKFCNQGRLRNDYLRLGTVRVAAE
jgi:hypothetical protein